MLKISKNISAAATDVLLPMQSWPQQAAITLKCQPHLEAISTLKEHVLMNGDVLVKTLITGRMPKLTFDPEVSISWGGGGLACKSTLSHTTGAAWSREG